MAKELPYFKFIVSEWNDGDVTLCSMTAQGLFTNICSLYWSKCGDLLLTKAKRKYKVKASVWRELIEEKIFLVENDQISISFLDEQFKDRKKLSETNRKNALIAAEHRKQLANAELQSSDGSTLVTNIEERRREKKREEENIKESACVVLIPNDESKSNFQKALKESQELADFFAVNQVANKAAMGVLASFIQWHVQNGTLENFNKQFEAYRNYKSAANEKTHGLKRFIGEPPHYMNGAWVECDWVEKLKSVKGKAGTIQQPLDPSRQPLRRNRT